MDSNATIIAAMNHAVGTSLAEGDRLGVPHHIVAVQGQGWSGDVSMYAVTPAPIAYDNVVYELHYYPSISGHTSSSYSYASTSRSLSASTATSGRARNRRASTPTWSR